MSNKKTRMSPTLESIELEIEELEPRIELSPLPWHIIFRALENLFEKLKGVRELVGPDAPTEFVNPGLAREPVSLDTPRDPAGVDIRSGFDDARGPLVPRIDFRIPGVLSNLMDEAD